MRYVPKQLCSQETEPNTAEFKSQLHLASWGNFFVYEEWIAILFIAQMCYKDLMRDITIHS